MCMTVIVIHSLTAMAGSLEMRLGISNIDLNLSLLPWWLWHFMSTIFSKLYLAFFCSFERRVGFAKCDRFLFFLLKNLLDCSVLLYFREIIASTLFELHVQG